MLMCIVQIVVVGFFIKIENKSTVDCFIWPYTSEYQL